MIYDAMIIGAGPAGASCAVWLSLLGFRPIVIERAKMVGGLSAHNPFQDAWNVTAPNFTGEQVAANIKHSLDSARVPVLLAQTVTGIERLEHIESHSPLFRVFFGDHNVLTVRHVVIASGVTHKRPPQMQLGKVYPYVLVGAGRHVYHHDFSDKKIAVLGGGDNAFENALYAINHGAQQVDIYARHVKAQKKWLNNKQLKHVYVGEYTFDPDLATVNDTPYDSIMVFYGYEPQLEGVRHLNLTLTETGHIWTEDKTAQTSLLGIYAIGEVANRMHPCMITSMADGVVAAKAIQRRLDEMPKG